jgi:UDP-glucose 4-epimerase
VKILVTGGTGRVGIAIVERLCRVGHELTVIGRKPGASVPGARYGQADINDPAALAEAVKGTEAIVHLAAIPGPGSGTPEEIFRINCLGTFNVYSAAARAGIRRVVTASSINAFGYNFGSRAFPVRRLPVDETLPGFSTDAYSFSKQVTERIADYAWRRDGISGTCLRLPWVAPADRSDRRFVLQHAESCRRSFEALMALPPEERRAKAAAWIAHRDAHRAGRGFENGHDYDNPDPLVLGRTDFWTRIDERDSAQAVEKSLLADYEGAHVLFVNDSHNFTGLPSLELARLFFPEALPCVELLGGTRTLVSIEAARRLIGYEPEFSVGRWFSDF